MRFIQVGVGGFGAGWLRILHRDEDAEIAGIVDTDAATLREAAEKVGLADSLCFQDYSEAFEQLDADAVLCVTPPDVHAPVARAAFEAGLHVLTEKPLADDMRAARSMVQAAEAADKKLMVSQNYRYRAWVRTMRYLVSSGQFGPADKVTVHFAKATRFEGSFRLKMEHPLVTDMSIHHFDLMRAITGSEPLTVYARTWRPEWSWFEHDPCAVALFEFRGDLRVLYDGSWVARGRQTTWEGDWSVECADAMIELRSGRVHILPGEHPDQDSEVELRNMPAEGQQFSLLEFRQAIAEDREPETSGRDNLRSLAMVFAATESARRGEVVHLDEIMAHQ